MYKIQLDIGRFKSKLLLGYWALFRAWYLLAIGF
jgi:hypothetical protein